MTLEILRSDNQKKIRENIDFWRNYILELQNWGAEKRSMKENLIERPCPVCKIYGKKIVFKAPVYNFVRCERCGLIYADVVLNDVEIENFYRKNEIYEAAWEKLSESIATNKDIPAYKSIVDIVLEYRNNDEMCLDIGCAFGKLSYEMTPYFKKVEGIELNEETARQCESVFGIKVYEKKLEELRLPSNSYDVVLLNQVIEHLNSLDLFEEIFRILQPGGIVYVGCPNVEGLSMRLFREKHTHVSSHGHINMFSKQSMNALAEKYRFSVVKNDSSNLDITFLDLLFYYTYPDKFLHRFNYNLLLSPISSLVAKITERMLKKMRILSNLVGGSYLEVVLKK